MTARAALSAAAAAVALAACGAMQTRVGDHLPEGRYIDSVHAASFSYGAMSVGKQKDLNLQRATGLGLVYAPNLDSYLQSVLNRVLAVAPVSNIPAEVHVRASEEFGAMSTADADIFLDLGLVRSMQSEDQLAFVLAHELSHVILGHTSSEIVKKTEQQALALTELGLAVGAQVRAAQGKGTGGMAHDARLKQQKQALALNSLVLSPAWTRGQEREADLLGTDMLVKAGYNPSAVDEVLAKLTEIEADPERVTADDMMQQIKALDLVSDKDMAKVTHAPAGTPPGLAPAADTLMNAFGQQALGYVGSKVQEAENDHPRAADRRADMRIYVDREYPGTAPAPQVEALHQAMQQPGTREVVAHYEQANDAWGFAQKDNMKVAEKLAAASVSGSTSDHVYPRYYFSLLRERQNDLRKALQNLELVYDSPEPALRVYQRASELQERLGNRKAAIALLEQADRKFDHPAALMPDLIQIYRRAGRGADADRLVVECTIKHPEIKDLCTGTKEQAS